MAATAGASNGPRADSSPLRATTLCMGQAYQPAPSYTPKGHRPLG